MYEYTPNRKKGREIITSLLLLGFGVVVYYVSLIPKVPYPVLFQIITVMLAAVAVLIVGKFVLRSYTYRVEPRERDDDPNAHDFVIIEHYGRRSTVVCRIGTEQIRNLVRPSKANRNELARQMKGRKIYRYTAEFAPPDLCVVEANADPNEDAEVICLKICADNSLLSLLQSFSNSNICPPYNQK